MKGVVVLRDFHKEVKRAVRGSLSAGNFPNFPNKLAGMLANSQTTRRVVSDGHFTVHVLISWNEIANRDGRIIVVSYEETKRVKGP